VADPFDYRNRAPVFGLRACISIIEGTLWESVAKAVSIARAPRGERVSRVHPKR